MNWLKFIASVRVQCRWTKCSLLWCGSQTPKQNPKIALGRDVMPAKMLLPAEEQKCKGDTFSKVLIDKYTLPEALQPGVVRVCPG